MLNKTSEKQESSRLAVNLYEASDLDDKERDDTLTHTLLSLPENRLVDFIHAMFYEVTIDEIRLPRFFAALTGIAKNNWSSALKKISETGFEDITIGDIRFFSVLANAGSEEHAVPENALMIADIKGTFDSLSFKFDDNDMRMLEDSFDRLVSKIPSGMRDVVVSFLVSVYTQEGQNDYLFKYGMSTKKDFDKTASRALGWMLENNARDEAIQEFMRHILRTKDLFDGNGLAKTDIVDREDSEKRFSASPLFSPHAVESLPTGMSATEVLDKYISLAPETLSLDPSIVVPLLCLGSSCSETLSDKALGVFEGDPKTAVIKFLYDETLVSSMGSKSFGIFSHLLQSSGMETLRLYLHQNRQVKNLCDWMIRTLEEDSKYLELVSATLNDFFLRTLDEHAKDPVAAPSINALVARLAALSEDTRDYDPGLAL